MDIPAEITHIERLARTRGLKLAILLADAGVDRSTWTRWKQGKTLPRLKTWLAVEASVRRIYGNEPILKQELDTAPSGAARS